MKTILMMLFAAVAAAPAHAAGLSASPAFTQLNAWSGADQGDDEDREREERERRERRAELFKTIARVSKAVTGAAEGLDALSAAVAEARQGLAAGRDVENQLAFLERALPFESDALAESGVGVAMLKWDFVDPLDDEIRAAVRSGVHPGVHRIHHGIDAFAAAVEALAVEAAAAGARPAWYAARLKEHTAEYVRRAGLLHESWHKLKDALEPAPEG